MRIKSFSIRFAIVVAVGVPSTIGCNGQKSEEKTATSLESRVVVAQDGHSQIEIPGEWLIRTNLREGAGLQVSSERGAESISVTTEPKTAFRAGLTYLEHSQLTQQRFLQKEIDILRQSEPEAMTVGGRRAVRFRVRYLWHKHHGTHDELHITVDGEHHFHELIVSLSNDAFTPAHPATDAIVATFRDIP